MNSTGVVLKTVERCNINCTYCYMFNLADQSYKNRSAYIKLDTIKDVSAFLKQGCSELNIKNLTIELHGGEPLMQKKIDFEKMINIFNDDLASVTTIDYALQTNAMLIDQEWIEIFYKYRIGVGVSIDGPKEYNDLERIDKKGRGTYDRVIKGLTLLKESDLITKMGGVGILSVINPAHSARKIYRHFVDILGLKYLDFILPHLTHDYKLPHPPEAYGEFLCELFDEWIKDDNPEIDIRFLKSTLNIFTGGFSYIYGILIDSEWIELFNKYRIGIGVSLDGPRDHNDRQRVDHKDQGTYDRVVNGINLLQKHKAPSEFGLLCVINPEYSAKMIYRHFVDELKIQRLDFLLPDFNYQYSLPYPAKSYGNFLCEIFQEWVTDNNSNIQIKFFQTAIEVFLRGNHTLNSESAKLDKVLPLISIASDGELSPTDELRNTQSKFVYDGSTVFNTTLTDFLKRPIFKTIEDALNTLPAPCQSCCWQRVCEGGSIVHRFSKQNGFNNPSLYCEGLQDFYASVSAYLLTNGYPLDKIISHLQLN